MGSKSSPLVVIDFLDQNYRYKSVASLISHTAGFAPDRLARDRITGSAACKAVTLPLCHRDGLYVYICMCVIERDREREKKGERERERKKIY